MFARSSTRRHCWSVSIVSSMLRPTRCESRRSFFCGVRGEGVEVGGCKGISKKWKRKRSGAESNLGRELAPALLDVVVQLHHTLAQAHRPLPDFEQLIYARDEILRAAGARIFFISLSLPYTPPSSTPTRKKDTPTRRAPDNSPYTRPRSRPRARAPSGRGGGGRRRAGARRGCCGGSGRAGRGCPTLRRPRRRRGRRRCRAACAREVKGGGGGGG